MQRRARTFTVVVAMSADSRDIAISIVTAGKSKSNAFWWGRAVRGESCEQPLMSAIEM
jgi:hypothetical protein